MDQPTSTDSKNDIRLLASNFFTWLLEPDQHDNAPLEVLCWAYADSMVCFSEILAICSFATLATHADAKLQAKLRLFRAEVEIPEDFLPFPQGLSGGSFQIASAIEILCTPEPKVASAVTDTVVAYLLKIRLTRRHRLSGLQVVAFQHPIDRFLVGTIKSVPGADTVLTKFVESRARNAEISLAGRGILVGKHGGLGPLYDCFSEACEALDVNPMPQLFIEQGPLGTRSLGIDQPIVVVSSATLSFLTRDELIFALGHELGHIKAGHLRYQAVAEGFRDTADLAADFTLGISKVLEGLTIGPVLSSWIRRAELTADRAGYLACQDKEVALRTILKLAGYPPSLYRELNSRTLVEQAAHLQEMLASSVFNRFYKLSQLWSAMQPFPILRAHELLEWLKDGYPEQLLDMSPAQMAKVQAWQLEDPILAEFTHVVVLIVADWAAIRYNLHPKQCRRIIRKLLLEGQSARNTNLACILQVNIILEKKSADSVLFTLTLLVYEGGKAIRTKIPISRSDSWDDVPKSYREEFIRSGQPSLEYSLYTA